MFSSENILATRFSHSQENVKNSNVFNPFQFENLLRIIERYDDYTFSNFVFSPSIYGLEMNGSKLRNEVLNIIESYDDIETTGYILLGKTSQLLSYTLSGLYQCEALLSISMKGILDINNTQYENILKDFEEYHNSLQSLNLNEPHKHMLSKKSEFKNLEESLWPSNLLRGQFPNAQDYSSNNYRIFMAKARSRIHSLMNVPNRVATQI